jgi:hypothetical protein
MKIQKFENFENIVEDKEEVNYMFFANIDHICKMMQEIKEMPKDKIDTIISEHDWASDHISRSFESISHVYNFLSAYLNGEEEDYVNNTVYL